MPQLCSYHEPEENRDRSKVSMDAPYRHRQKPSQPDCIIRRGLWERKNTQGENFEPRPLLPIRCGTMVRTHSHPTIDVWIFTNRKWQGVRSASETLNLGTGHGATRGAGEVSFAEKETCRWESTQTKRSKNLEAQWDIQHETLGAV